MSCMTFCTWGRGMKVTIYQNDILFTYLCSVLIFIKKYSNSIVLFFQFLAKNYESYLTNVIKAYTPLPHFVPHKNLFN